MAQDEPSNVSLNEELSTPFVPQQQITTTNPSTRTPLVSIMVLVPTTDLAVVDPITAMKEYLRSLSTLKLKSQSIEAATSTGFEIVVSLFYDNLIRMLDQH